MRRRLAPLLVLLASACVDAGPRNAQATPAFYVDNTKAYADTAAGLPPETVYAWDLRIEGQDARWRECASPEICGTVERTRPVKELLGKQRVGETSVEGRRVDVLKLSLEARRTYVVPSFKP
jgi:hypothetical protein